MRKLISIILLSLVGLSGAARADMFGGDDVILADILSNAIEQLYRLEEIVRQTQDSLELMRDINQGVNDSLNLVRTVSSGADPGLYGDWTNAAGSLQKLRTLYGRAVTSRDSVVQNDVDQNIAEAITLNNSLYSYTRDIDGIGEQVKDFSHATSPGGASKLTAETLGVMLHVMDQSLRAQATGLKLQAQSLAVQNRKDKEMTHHVLDSADTLGDAMRSAQPAFVSPRY